MSGTGRQINYSLRPKKQIERKLIVETVRRLETFHPMDAYRYIGFGSFYFHDFLMLHRLLDVSKMVSIEKSQERERFEQNRPFKCIDIEFGHSHEVLPALAWDDPTILWLDYDDVISGVALQDVGTFITSAASGSVCAVTVNVRPGDFADLHAADTDDEREEQFEKARSTLSDRLGDSIPFDLKPRDLLAGGLSETCRRILNERVESVLRDRCGEQNGEWQAQQIFHFNYRDGTKMLTVGWLLYNRADAEIVEQSRILTSDGVRTGDDPFNIDPPLLTIFEAIHLNSQLPSDDLSQVERRGIPVDDIEKYASVYRHFPTYAEFLL